MFAPVLGNSIYYVEEGAASSLPVIFIHGFPFNHEMWKEQLAWIGNQYRAISYDVRGHGKSDSGDGQYTIESHVDDLMALIDYLKLDQVVLVGLSMGGYIALRAMEKSPEKIIALVLSDTKSEADSGEAKIKRFESMRDIKKNGTSPFAQSFVKNVFTAKSLENKPSASEMIRRSIESISPLNIAANLLALASRTDTTESLSKIQVPTLIMVGENDKVTPVANSQTMHEKIQGSELVIIPDAAHLSNLENPTVFNDKLLQFLGKLQTKVKV